MNEHESLFQFVRGTVTTPSAGAAMECLLVVVDNHIRPCSEVEEKLYELLREATNRALAPDMKRKIWAVIGNE